MQRTDTITGAEDRNMATAPFILVCNYSYASITPLSTVIHYQLLEFGETLEFGKRRRTNCSLHDPACARLSGGWRRVDVGHVRSRCPLSICDSSNEDGNSVRGVLPIAETPLPI